MKNDILDAWKFFCVFREKFRKITRSTEEHPDMTSEEWLKNIGDRIILISFQQGEIAGNELKDIYEAIRDEHIRND